VEAAERKYYTHDEPKAITLLISGRNALEKKDYQAAMRNFKKSHKCRITKTLACLLLHQMANCMDHLEYYDQQQTFLEELCDLEPNFKNVQQLMNIYLKTNNEIKAKSMAERIKLLPVSGDEDEKQAILLLTQAKDHDEVIRMCRKWLETHPGDTAMEKNILNTYLTQEKIEDAFVYINELQKDGEKPELYPEMASVQKELFFFEEGQDYIRKHIKNNEDNVSLTSINARMLITGGTYQGTLTNDEYSYWIHKICEGTKLPSMRTVEDFNPSTEYFRKIVVGIISYDLRTHVVGKFIMSAFAEFSANTGIEIVCYYTMPDYEDEITAGIKEASDDFKYVGRYSDKQLRKELLDDECDILIDLNGCTIGTKVGLLAERFAPIQCTWLGTSYSSFTYNIDYIIGDRFVDSADGETQKYTTEKALPMDGCAWCYATIIDYPIVPDPPQIKNGYITFGMFNSPNRHSAESIRLWKNCMDAVPGSRLLIKTNRIANDFLFDKYKDRLVRFGLDLDRVDFDLAPGQLEYFEAYNKCDVILESMPLGGGTTSAEAIMMGVPVIGLAYSMRTARISYTMMHNVELGHLCADSKENYVKKVIEISKNIDLLRDLRTNLRGRLREYPLFDMPAFRVNFENAMRDAWLTYCYTHKKQLDGDLYKNNDAFLLRDCARAADILKREAEKDDFDAKHFPLLVNEYLQIHFILLERLFELYKNNAGVLKMLVQVSEILETIDKIEDTETLTQMTQAIRGVIVKFA